MNQTLLTIPHQWLGAPLMIAWLVLGVLTLLYLLQKQGLRGSFLQTLVMIAVGLVAIRFLIPQIEVLGVDSLNPDGPLVPEGMAIRGYGLFLMLGILAGITLCQWRARQIGVDPEKILSLCFWLVVVGLLGARLFYVIQYWDSYAAAKSTGEMLAKLADMTEGGLVVYGSFFGGLVAWIVFCWRTKLPLWKIGDIMAPAMMAGLACGRIGCLMNGCCYGGACDTQWLGMQFPPGAPAYYRQLETGALLGIPRQAVRGKKQASEYPIRQLKPGSLAEMHGIRVGDRVARIVPPEDVWLRTVKNRGFAFSAPERSMVFVQCESGSLAAIPVAELPDVSLPVWPTQLFSAITAFLLCGLLWFYYPFRRADGELMALLLILYSVSRVLEEFIRADEPGAFGTSFTISQQVSVACFCGGVVLFVWLRANTSATRRGAPV